MEAAVRKQRRDLSGVRGDPRRSIPDSVRLGTTDRVPDGLRRAADIDHRVHALLDDARGAAMSGEQKTGKQEDSRSLHCRRIGRSR